MKKTSISMICVAAALSLTNLAHAEVKIATVDVARIMNEAPGSKEKKKQLDAASEEAKNKLETKGKALQALKTKLEGQKVAANSKEAEGFRNQAREFEQLRAEAKADLEKQYLKVNKELSDKVMGKIEAYAKANSYDLVIDKSEKFRGPVLYGKSSADITEDILDQM
ncbi:MAG: OmpH family outer membrane protein [Pseudomonadota bacterium]|jgi:outer membrane protein